MYKKVFCILVVAFVPMILAAQSGVQTAFFPGVTSFKLLAVDKQKPAAIRAHDKPLTLFVFLSPECPVCQNYTKTMKELQQQYNKQVEIYGIIPGKAYSVKEVAAFEKKYQTGLTILIDEKQALTKYLEATVTPQAILLNNKFELVYTGAIDDWAIAPGKKRLQVSQHYLADAIGQSLKSIPVAIPKTQAVGCKINDY